MSIHDLSDAILALSVPVTVTRFAEAVTFEGYKQPAEETTFDINASIQPLMGRDVEDLKQLPEGMSTEGVVKVFSVEELRAGSVKNNTESDRFEYKGLTYQIELVKDWSDLGNYYESFAVRVDR